MSKSLTPKQARFVEEYLVDSNASAAARRAGYSERTADAIGRETLGKPTVAAAIQGSIAKREARTEITQDRVLRELALIAFGNKRDLMQWGPGGLKLTDSTLLTAEQSAQVSEVKDTTSATGGSPFSGLQPSLLNAVLLGKRLRLPIKL